MENFYEYEEEYRDSIGTVDKEGKDFGFIPKSRKGSFIQNAVSLLQFY